MKLPDRNLAWPIAWRAVEEIARSEGCRLRAYRDVAGVWTIGWGETEGVTPIMVWTQEQADRQLCVRLREFDEGVHALLTRPATSYQFGAMVSLAYNIGLAAFARSSVLAAHNRGDFLSAARAFALWNKATINGRKQVVAGLTARRAREAALYLEGNSASLDTISPEHTGAAIDMPAADPESRMAGSPIAQSGAVSIATGGLAAASSFSTDIREISWGFGVDPLLVVAAVAIGVGAVVLWQRYKQRREGWA